LVVDGDPLKGGDKRCREVEDGMSASRTMAAVAGRSWRRRWRSFPLLQRPLVDRLRVYVGEGVGGAVNLVPSAPAPVTARKFIKINHALKIIFKIYFASLISNLF